MAGGGGYSTAMKLLQAILFASFTATSLSAHPHVFIDTGFELIVDGDGRLTHVRVIWEYDELYSLLITEDLGLDGDGDGALTSAGIAQLRGFDMHWVEGFNGDLVIETGERRVALSGPQSFTASFADGRVTSTHLRAFDQPVMPGEVATLRPYDATYYTAYDVTRPVMVTGGGSCKIDVIVPEMNSGLIELQEQLAGLDAETDPKDAGLPEIGAQLANSVIVTCDAP